jgi:frataxin-like iron-binding protein CyaY
MPFSLTNLKEKYNLPENYSLVDVDYSYCTTEKYIFFAYYAQDRNLLIARLELDSGEITEKKLSSCKIAWDSHSHTAIETDKDGHIHVSANMHVDPLVYYRSQKPYDISAFEKFDRMVGRNEEKVTYPKFFKNRESDLFFMYRYGTSGDGDTFINKYSTDKSVWKRVNKLPLFSSSKFDEIRKNYSYKIKEFTVKNIDGEKYKLSNGVIEEHFADERLREDFDVLVGRFTYNNDGDDQYCFYDKEKGIFYLQKKREGDYLPINHVFRFGPVINDPIAVSGDWDGDGVDGVGIVDRETGQVFLKNRPDSGNPDLKFKLHLNKGEVPIVGDWYSTGFDTFAVYNPDTKSLKIKNRNLSNNVSAYPIDPYLDSEDFFNFVWVWRADKTAASTFNVNYAKTKNFEEWFDSDGNKLELPLTPISSECVVKIPPYQGLINNNLTVAVNRDKTIIVFQKNDEENNTQLYTATKIGGAKWQIDKLTDWDYRWDINKKGTLFFEISISGINNMLSGYQLIRYNHKIYGRGLFCVRLDNMRIFRIGTESIGIFEPTISVEDDDYHVRELYSNSELLRSMLKLSYVVHVPIQDSKLSSDTTGKKTRPVLESYQLRGRWKLFLFLHRVVFFVGNFIKKVLSLVGIKR